MAVILVGGYHTLEVFAPLAGVKFGEGWAPTSFSAQDT